MINAPVRLKRIEPEEGRFLEDMRDTLFLQEMEYTTVDSRLKPCPGWRTPAYGLKNFFENWDEDGGAGYIALDAADQHLGAAWYRTGSDRDCLWEDSVGVPEVMIALRPYARSQGLGTMLLGNLMRLATVDGIRELRLYVANDNEPAKRLYDSSGFKEVGFVAFRRFGTEMPAGLEARDAVRALRMVASLDTPS